MENGTLRQRQKHAVADTKAFVAEIAHPGGDVKHGGAAQIFRLLVIVTYFVAACTSYVFKIFVYLHYADFPRIVVTQLIGAPLYWINRDLYYAYMALTKQSFALFVTTLTHWFSPTMIRISGDSSVAGQIRKTKDGRVEFNFPDRIIMIANHQVGGPP